MAKFMESTSSIKNSVKKKKKKDESAKAKTTKAASSKPKTQSSVSSKKAQTQKTVNRLSNKYAGGSTRNTSKPKATTTKPKATTTTTTAPKKATTTTSRNPRMQDAVVQSKPVKTTKRDTTPVSAAKSRQVQQNLQKKYGENKVNNTVKRDTTPVKSAADKAFEKQRDRVSVSRNPRMQDTARNTKVQSNAERQESLNTAKRAIRNTPTVAKESAKQVLQGHGKTAADVTAMNNSAAIGSKIDIKSPEFMRDIEKRREASTSTAKKTFKELAKAQDRSEQRLNNITKNARGLEKAYYGAVQSGTGILTDIAIGAGTQAGSLAAMGSRVYGNARGQAQREGATEDEDRRYAFMQAAKEVGTELMFPGVGLAGKAYGKKAALPLAERLANRATRNLTGKAADVAGAGIRLLGGTAEENIEEVAGWGLDPLIKEYTYGKNVRVRGTQNLMQQESNALRSNIRTREDADRAASYLNSQDFLDENIRQYMDAGLSQEQAQKAALQMRDYLTASLTGNTQEMQRLESDIMKTVSNKKWTLADWDRNELVDTLMSTTLLTGVTGLPGAVTTSRIGHNVFNDPDVRKFFGDDAQKVVANEVINSSDETNSLRAQAMRDRLNSGKDLTGTQKYDLWRGYQQKTMATAEKQSASVDLAERNIARNNYVQPVTLDENGRWNRAVRNEYEYYQLGDETQRKYEENFDSALATAETLRASVKSEEDSETKSITETTEDRTRQAAAAVAALKDGYLTIGDVHEFGFGNTLARETLKAETGIDLNQYIVRNSDGTVNYAKTNEATENALFAIAADNMVKTAKAETETFIDHRKGEIDKDLMTRFGAEGQKAWKDINKSLDPRETARYLASANAASYMYAAGRNTTLDQNEAVRSMGNVFRTVDNNVLVKSFEAGRQDREIAMAPAVGQTVSATDSMAGTDTVSIPTGSLTMDEDMPRSIPDSEQQIYKALAEATGVNIHLASHLDLKDEEGNVIGQANGSSYGDTIVLNVNSAAEQNLGYVFMHEMTHQIKKYAPAEYTKLENLIRDAWFEKDYAGMQREIRHKMDLYGSKATQNLSEADAFEEIVADAMAEAIDDPRFARAVCTEDVGMGRAILNSIRNALRSLRDMIANTVFRQNNNFHKNLLSYLDVLSEAESLWIRALNEATKARAAQAVDELQNRIYEEGRKSISEKPSRKMSDRWENGEKLTHSQFNSWYSAHKLSYGRVAKENLDEAIEKIKADGFVSSTSISNVVPASINDFTDPKKPNDTQARYGAREGDVVMFVPRPYVDLKNDIVKNGFKPRDYEVVTVERDFQPYYELYEKAYDDAQVRYSVSDIMSEKDISDDLRGRFDEYKEDKENLRIAAEAVADLQLVRVEGRSGVSETGRDMDSSSVTSGRTSDRRPRNVYSQYRTIAKGITSDIVSNGYIDFRGKRVNNPEELAKLCQVLRDPRYETFRIFLLKGNKIVSCESVSSRLPGISVAHKGKSDSFYYEAIKNRMKRTGADGYYLMHNHPSGDVKASMADLNLSAKAINELGSKGYRGHVILDHDKFGLIEDIPTTYSNGQVLPTAKEVEISGQRTLDFIHEPEMDHPLLGQKVSNDQELATIGRFVNTSKDVSALVYLTPELNVRGIQEVSNKAIANNKEIIGFIRNSGTEFGAPYVALFTTSSDPEVEAAVQDLYQNGVFIDAITGSNIGSLKWLGANQNGDPFVMGRDTEEILKRTVVYESVSGANNYDSLKYSISPQMDADYMSAVNSGNMEEAQRLVDQAARRAGMRVVHRYHGSMNANFTVFSKAKAHVGGNSGAGFYFSTSKEDSEAHYADSEGADNFFKIQSFADYLMEFESEWNGREIDSDETAMEIAREELNKNPGMFDVYLNYKKPYVRDFKNSTNIYEDLYSNFDESVIDRDDYDDEDDYESDLYYYRTEDIAEQLNRAVYAAYGDLEDNYEVIDAPMVSDVVDKILEHAFDYESITWDDIQDAIFRAGETQVTRDDWTESGDATPEYARAIIENLGYDAIEDKEVSSKFGQLSREMQTDTEHIIVFQPEQIKLSDPVTYAEDGSVIPLSERFDPTNNDIRYSLLTQDSDGNILSDGQMEYFKNSQARDEQGRLVPVYHGTQNGGFTIFDSRYGISSRYFFFVDSLSAAKGYSGSEEMFSESVAGEEDMRLNYKAYLDMVNPLIVDAQGNSWVHIPYEDDFVTTNWLAEYAESEGYDGVIVKNVIDRGSADTEYAPQTDYIAFNSNQIKDTRNTNPTENPDIRYSIPSEDEVRDYIAATAKSIDDIPLRDVVLEQSRVRYSITVEEFQKKYINSWNERDLTFGYRLDEDSVEKHIIAMMKHVMSESGTNKKYKADVLEDTMNYAKIIWYEMKAYKTDDFAKTAWKAAENIVNAIDYNDDLYVQYKGVRDYLTKRKIQIPENMKYDENFAELVRDNDGRMRFSENGSSVNAVYKYLAKNYPELFPTEMDDQIDMLLQIDYALDLTSPYREVYTSEEYANLVDSVATSLIDIISEGEAYRSVADELTEKFETRTKAMKQRHEEAIRKIKADRNQKIQKQKDYTKLWKERKNRQMRELKDENKRQLKTQKMKYEYEIAELKLNRDYNIGRLKAEKYRVVKAEKEKRNVRDKERRQRQVHKRLYNSILKEYKDLSGKLLNPSKDRTKNIPEQLRQPLAEMLYCFDLEKARSKELEEQYMIPTRVQLNFRQLKDALQRVVKEDAVETEFEAYFNYIKDKMEKVAEKVDGKTIDYLDNEDLDTIKDMMKGLSAALRNWHQIETDREAYQAQQICDKLGKAAEEHQDMYGRARKRGFLDNIVNMGELTPIYFFRQIGGMYDMYKELRKGFDTYVDNEKEIIDKISDILAPFYKTNKKGQRKKGSDIEEWRHSESAETFDLTYGPLKLTVAQKMSLYCLAKRPQAQAHMFSDNGGVIAAETTPGAIQNKVKEIAEGREISHDRVILTPADVQRIIGTLTPEQKKAADQLQQLMSKDMSELGNKTSIKLIDIAMYKEENYFPIKVDGDSRATQLEKIGIREKVRNPGFSNPLVENASNPIILDDIFTVVASHCNEMNMYASYAVPLTNFMKVYNGSVLDEKTGQARKVKEVIRSTYGDKAIQYIENFLDDINGNSFKRHGGLDDVLDRALGRAKRSAVFINFRVATQQPTAIVRALAVMNPKYFAGVKPSAKATREMFEHCPIAQWKSWGYYDTHFGRDIEDVMTGSDVTSKLDFWMSEVYGKLDNMTWGMIWQAVKKEVKSTHKGIDESSQEFWDLCNERASFVFDTTQVVDSPFHRSNDMRSKNGLVKQLTSFQAEPTLSFNVLRQGIVDTIDELKRGNKSKASKALTRVLLVWFGQAACVAFAQSLIDALRRKGRKKKDDDEDENLAWYEEYMKYFMRNLPNNFKDDVNAINNIYFVKEIVPPILNALEGEYVYGQQNLAFQWVDTLTTGIEKIRSTWEKGGSAEDWYDAFTELLGGFGYLAGFPSKTVMRGTKNAFHWFNKITGADVFAADGNTNKKISSFIDSIKSHVDSDSDESDGESSGKGSDSTAEGSWDDVYKQMEAEEEQLAKLEEKAAKKAASAPAGQKDEVLWDTLTDGYTNKLKEGRMDYIDSLRDIYVRTGGREDVFDSKLLDGIKRSYKSTINADNTADQMEGQYDMQQFMLNHGITAEEISDMCYHSYTAKDLKAAMRLGNEEYMIDELVPLIQAGFSEEDFNKCWKQRYNYRNYTGKYTDPKYRISTGEYAWPITGTITSRFGGRKSPGGVGSTNHMGLDIAGSMGDPVHAADGGEVIYADWWYGGGNVVRIRHENGEVTEYMHLSGYNCKVGDHVGKGDQIGQVGSTGNSTGPHLHFGVMDKDGNHLDPEVILAQSSKG